ncbi:MAG: NAD-dependent epimerase/dehydratase family protein [Rhodospirillaceae bacterium]|jgi:nucleoside-diphosphate-sugar epimerase|nr:NAD-dependent epimerase/dehydratase family protein [Rhodospirillaceae bacterium]MBT3929408.1 NAD-dependent epimerase/dehydratase family protein [Rhodospirillaceae bacterium]MBT4773707.1 NAD-dependent epimerase/dehydratase family protein [Rhodospirillaceae bacterium]MBT5357637.1 NAD-dependent epimerase/dehydratase family protein [Rhodospirillaceae bacterium]MBT5770626.1 NAD-dependent epimerase/dehydratase family protein [Rhodospirillaceae bacterium]
MGGSSASSNARSAPQFRSALVTGATGFLGAHLTRRLTDAGVAVTAIVRPTSDQARVAGLRECATVHPTSGAYSDLIAGFEAASPDVVFHLAARFASTHAPGDIAGLIEDNVTFTAHLCEAAVATECLALVAAGTAWQNAGSPSGDSTPAPNTLYASSKQAADDVIDYYSRLSGLNAITLKIYDSYGPNDPRRKFLTVLRDASANDETIDATPGDQKLHMVHVDDLIDGFVHAGNQSATGELRGRASYTLPSNQAVTLRELAELWMSANNRRVEINWGIRPHRDGEVMAPWDGEPLPGWSPQVDLKAGLKDC